MSNYTSTHHTATKSRGKRRDRAQGHSDKVVKSIKVDNEIIFYGKVEKSLGSNNISVRLIQDTKKDLIITCRIPGKYRKSLYINPGNYVLVEVMHNENDDTFGEILAKLRDSDITIAEKDGILYTNTNNDGMFMFDYSDEKDVNIDEL